MTTAAREAIAVLKANGIERIFGNPGTTELALLEATVSGGVAFHLCLNEGVAVAMADGYGRATGSVGVVMVHTSVGTANTLTNLINLRSDRSPLLVIAGDKDDRLTGRGCFCEVPDMPGLVRQVTKEAWRVTLPEKLPELVQRGLKVAEAPPRGPVFIAAPENYMLEELAPGFAGRYARRADSMTMRAHPDDLRALLRALTDAERPLLVAGNEIGASDSVPLLVEIAEKLCVPVVGEEVFTTNAMNFPTDHPYYHGNFAPAVPVVRDADLVVAIGARMFMEYSWPEKPYLQPGVRLIQVGGDPSELGKIYPTELALLGDAGDAVRDLHGMLATRSVPPGKALEARRARARGRPASLREDPRGVPHPWVPMPGEPMHPQRLLAVMSEILPPDVAIVDESVLSKSMMQSCFRLGEDRRYFGTSGGGLGWGIAAAVGVQLGMSSRRVVAFVGDGGALFNIQALWSAAHLHAPLIVVVVNNGGYMAVRRGLGQVGGACAGAGSYPGSALARPEVDFCAIARGFGVRAASASSEREVGDALHWALATNEPALIDARVAASVYY